MTVAKPRKKSSPVPWVFAACVVLGLGIWGVMPPNKPPQTRTLSVTDDASVQRERDTAETAAAQAKEAEQEKQLLAAQAKAREDAAKEAAERQRLADLAEKEKLALVAQAKAKEAATQLAQQRLAEAQSTAKPQNMVVGLKVNEESVKQSSDQQRMTEQNKPTVTKVIEATKDNPFVNSLGMKFVPVPIIGGSTVAIKVFFSIWETRIQDYSEYLKDRNLTKWEGTHISTDPAYSISWDEAKAFCQWLTTKERSSGRIGALDEYRLPSDHEWSCAAGIGGQENASDSPAAKDSNIAGVFPWGDTWPPPKGAGNFYLIKAKNGEVIDDGYILSSPVGLFIPNGFGIYDLAGNQWEWCEDWFDPAKKDLRVLRGGSCCNNDSLRLRSSFRNRNRPSTSDEIIYGFRCVLVVSAR